MKPSEVTAQQKKETAPLREEKPVAEKKAFVKPSAKGFALPEVTFGTFFW